MTDAVVDVAKPKTERELAKERAKAEKMAKYAEKQRKMEKQQVGWDERVRISNKLSLLTFVYGLCDCLLFLILKAAKVAEDGGKKAKKGATVAKGPTEYHWRTKIGDKKGKQLVNLIL